MIGNVINNIASFFQDMLDTFYGLFDINYGVLLEWLPSDIAGTTGILFQTAVWVGVFFLIKKVVEFISSAFRFIA